MWLFLSLLAFTQPLTVCDFYQAATNNPHVREERGIDDSGVNEEDK